MGYKQCISTKSEMQQNNSGEKQLVEMTHLELREIDLQK
jgi:hypothetical protein